jgi:hypothetical protein
MTCSRTNTRPRHAERYNHNTPNDACVKLFHNRDRRRRCLDRSYATESTWFRLDMPIICVESPKNANVRVGLYKRLLS